MHVTEKILVSEADHSVDCFQLVLIAYACKIILKSSPVQSTIPVIVYYPAIYRLDENGNKHYQTLYLELVTLEA